MPIARQAHERVEFSNIHASTTANGSAIEREMPDGIPYREWAGGIVKVELHKAGWRLANLLDRILR